MRWRWPAGLAVAVTAAAMVAVMVTTGASSSDPVPDPPTLVPPAGRSAFTAGVTGHAVGGPIRAGFLGLSIEFQAVRAYTGSDPHRINPVLVQLIRNLTPGQSPVLRIGGNSTDVSYIPVPGVRAPAYLTYRLTPSWMATTAALAHALGARMIMGLNLGANRPVLAAAEARAYVGSIGSSSIAALEIGNEPNVFDKIAIYRTPDGGPLKARPAGYGYPAFRREFRAVAAASPPLALAGPALATGPTAGPGSWIHTISDFLRREPRLRIMSVHRYPLRNCNVPPSSVQYPTVRHLLAPYATAGLAASLRRWIALAHAQHRLLRVDELNSVACRGKRGVSDRFASSLWIVNALFALARAGVDGVNMHTLPRSAYQLFAFSRAGGRWRAAVKPVYYGLQLFGQAAPPGSRLLALRGVRSRPGLSLWATRAPDGRVRVTLVNESPSHGQTITLRPPPGTAAGATIERLQAPSVHAWSGISLGGRTYGGQTSTGRLAAPRLALLTERRGAYKLSVARASAALVTFGR